MPWHVVYAALVIITETWYDTGANTSFVTFVLYRRMCLAPSGLRSKHAYCPLSLLHSPYLDFKPQEVPDVGSPIRSRLIGWASGGGTLD